MVLFLHNVVLVPYIFFKSTTKTLTIQQNDDEVAVIGDDDGDDDGDYDNNDDARYNPVKPSVLSVLIKQSVNPEYNTPFPFSYF